MKTTARHKTAKPAAAKKPVEGKVIKLQVDYRTIILVRNKRALDMWMHKYPKAKIVA